MSKTSNKSNARSTNKVALAQKNNKKNTKNSRTRRTNRRGNPKGSIPSVHLSQCAADYAAAKLRPFESDKNVSPCIPDLLDLPSYKFSVIQKGEFAIGQDGFGFILMSPFPNCNDAYNVWVSQASYPNDFIPALASATGVTGASLSRYPWSTAEARKVRTVASAMRLRYTGTELNRGGRLILSQHPGLGGDFDGMDATAILSSPEARSFPVSRAWRTMTFNPGYSEAFEYHNQTYPLGNGTPYNGKMVAVVTGEVGNTFEFETIYYYEAISKSTNLVPNVSKSHSDPTGLGLVKDYLGEFASGVIESSSFKNFLTYSSRGAAAAVTTYFTGMPASSSVPLIQYL